MFKLVSIDNLPDGYNIFLVRSGPMDVKNRNVEIVSALTEMDYSVIIVTANTPSEIQLKQYDDSEIDTSKLHFIDMVTSYAMGRRQEDQDQISYVERPGDLTKAGIVITKMIKESSSKKFAFLFDTVNTLLIYNKPATVTRFIHFVINKLRLNEGKGFFIVVEKSLESELLSDFEMLADMSIPRDEAIKLIKSGISEEVIVPDEDSNFR